MGPDPIPHLRPLSEFLFHPDRLLKVQQSHYLSPKIQSQKAVRRKRIHSLCGLIVFKDLSWVK